MNRGEVWQVSFDPAVGGEIQKTRPAVIVSRDSTGALPLRIVVPLTSWRAELSRYPWMVRIDPSMENGLHNISMADAFQVKSVSVRRIVKRIGLISTDRLDALVKAVGLVIDHP